MRPTAHARRLAVVCLVPGLLRTGAFREDRGGHATAGAGRDLLVETRPRRALDMLHLMPFLALSVALGLVTMWTETYHVGASGEEWSLPPVARFLLAGRALWFYAGKLAWPHPLVFFYPRWTIDVRAVWQYLFPLAALAVPVALWLARASLGRGPLAAVLIYAGVLVPTLGFFNVYYARFAYVSDHFQYHASVALLGLAAAGIARTVDRLRPPLNVVANASVGLLIVALSVISWRQTQIYDNLEKLYRDTIAKNPRGWTAYSNLASYLDGQGRHEEALALARQALPLGATSRTFTTTWELFCSSRPRVPEGRPSNWKKPLPNYARHCISTPQDSKRARIWPGANAAESHGRGHQGMERLAAFQSGQRRGAF